MTESNNTQKAHYEKIHDAYEMHYYDDSSMAYRHRFIYDPLFGDADLKGASVADLACGSGHNTLALRSYFPDIRAKGFDISESACRDYRLLTGFPAAEIDLTRPATFTETFDGALVIGGLHHCVADLPQTFANVARLVRPGGRFMMMEPNDDFLLSAVRRLWYRSDHWFDADTEAALKHDRIARSARPYFEPEKVVYFGGPAFYLILNSLITRVPLSVKPALSRLLFPLEKLYGAIPGKAPFAAFLAVWRRTDAAV